MGAGAALRPPRGVRGDRRALLPRGEVPAAALAPLRLPDARARGDPVRDLRDDPRLRPPRARRGRPAVAASPLGAALALAAWLYAALDLVPRRARRAAARPVAASRPRRRRARARGAARELGLSRRAGDRVVSDTVLGLGLVVAGYLSGSIPFGVLLGRFVLGVDVRHVGSGTSARRTSRAPAAEARDRRPPPRCAEGDRADPRRALAPRGARRGRSSGRCSSRSPPSSGTSSRSGSASRAARASPPGLGIFLVLAPWAALAGLSPTSPRTAATRISSVGSLAGTAVCALGTFVGHGWTSPVSWAGLALAALIVVRHRENIRGSCAARRSGCACDGSARLGPRDVNEPGFASGSGAARSPGKANRARSMTNRGPGAPTRSGSARPRPPAG